MVTIREKVIFNQVQFEKIIFIDTVKRGPRDAANAAIPQRWSEKFITDTSF